MKIDGWKKVPVSHTINKFVVHCTIPESELSGFGTIRDTIDYAKDEMAQQLFREICKSDSIIFEMSKNPMTNSFKLTTGLFIGTPDNSFKYSDNMKFSYEGTSFKVNGQHFTEDEIINAIKETYPEKVI